MAILPLDSFLCWKLKIATFVIAVYLIPASALAAILEILDIAAWADDSFEIAGGFRSSWRSHVWEGWLACNIVMLFCHLILIGFSILIILAIKRFPTYFEYLLTRAYLVILICYILIDLGVCLYKYSWYGPNTYRRPFLVFSFLYWLVRTLLNITSVIVIYSRIAEVRYEIQYGEKKLLSKYSSHGNILDFRSGAATPLPGSQSMVGQSYA